MLVEYPSIQKTVLLNLNSKKNHDWSREKIHTNLFNALNAPVAEPGLMKNLLSRSNASNLCV
jgi:hypothetical protein